MTPDRVVEPFEPEEHLVRFVIIAEARGFERLDEVDVEVSLGLGGRAVVRCAEEEIAVALDPAVQPFDLVLPYLVASNVRSLVGALHELADGAVVGAVEHVVGEGFGPLLDLSVVVDVLLQIEIVLLGVRRLGDELPVDGLQRLPQDRLDLRMEVRLRLAAHILDAGLEKAQGVTKLLRGRTDGHIDVSASRQAVYRKPVNDPQRHRLIGRAGERLGDTLRQYLRNLEHRADVRVSTQDLVGLHCLPELVVADQARPILRHFAVQNRLDLVAERDEGAALFREHQPLERADIIGMDGEQPDVLVHALIHGAVELGERYEVGPDLVLLIGRLLQQALRHHEAHILPREQDLREAVLHPVQASGDVLEATAVEDRFLDSGHETEPQVLRDLADLA